MLYKYKAKYIKKLGKNSKGKSVAKKIGKAIY